MRPADIYGECVAATARFVREAGFDQVVIGLSGGIDSSLVAAIAADALDASCVHGVLLPGPFSSAHSVTDAEQLARNIGIPIMTMPITAAYQAFAEAFAAAAAAPLAGVASENTQARCRTVAIMALSNAYGWLMLNTGNKSEAAMGYSTLYGDTAGAFAPIGGIYKTQVRALCAWRNASAAERGEVPPIPQHVLDKPPSAELAADQSDEASLGVDYATLDAVLIELVERERTPQAVAQRLDVPAEQVASIAARYEANAFKRALEPPYPQARFYE